MLQKDIDLDGLLVKIALECLSGPEKNRFERLVINTSDRVLEIQEKLERVVSMPDSATTTEIKEMIRFLYIVQFLILVFKDGERDPPFARVGGFSDFVNNGSERLKETIESYKISCQPASGPKDVLYPETYVFGFGGIVPLAPEEVFYRANLSGQGYHRVKVSNQGEQGT